MELPKYSNPKELLREQSCLPRVDKAKYKVDPKNHNVYLAVDCQEEWCAIIYLNHSDFESSEDYEDIRNSLTEFK